MPPEKLKFNKIDLDSLNENLIISIDQSADYNFEMVSGDIIDHLTITDLIGNIIHESDINSIKFVFNYSGSSRQMFLLKIRKHRQQGESRILIL